MTTLRERERETHLQGILEKFRDLALRGENLDGAAESLGRLREGNVRGSAKGVSKPTSDRRRHPPPTSSDFFFFFSFLHLDLSLLLSLATKTAVYALCANRCFWAMVDDG